MSDNTGSVDIIAALEARIQYLEEVNRFTLEALEMARSLGDFQPGVDKILSIDDIVRETFARLSELVYFKTASFYLVDEQTSEFKPCLHIPEDCASGMEAEVERLIEEGTFSWALREIRPFVISTGSSDQSLLLHVIGTSRRIRGMLVAVLGKSDIPDVTLNLISLVLLHCANALQSFELYNWIKVINKELESNVQQLISSEMELKKTNQRLRREVEAHENAREARRQAERKFQDLFENALEGIYLSTLDGRFMEANPSMARILGYDDPQDLINSISDISSQLYADPDRRGQFMDELLRSGTVTHFESRCRRKDRSLVWVSENCRAVPAEDGSIARLEGFMQDITDRKEAEERSEDQQRQLRQADKMAALGVLVAGVAHEINNPNGVIMLNTPLLAKAWHSAVPILEEHYRRNGDFLIGGLKYSLMKNEIPGLFSELKDATIRIKSIVNDLKNFARQDSGESAHLMDINESVQAAMRLVHHKIKKSTRNIVVECAEGLPPVKGSFQKIEQVLINLLINACQALPSPDRGIHVATRHDRDMDVVEVMVRDEGVGMSDEVLQHIQDPFFTTKRDSGGTGLGLAVSAGIVKEHGGTLAYDSAPGQGAAAILRLPAAAADRAALQEGE
ncbi:MAG: sensor histidine kinase [Desulfovibrionaceae bacterium]